MEWIHNLPDKLPHQGQRVLLYIVPIPKGDHIGWVETGYRERTYWILDKDDYAGAWEAKYWMPFPEPPKEVE